MNRYSERRKNRLVSRFRNEQNLKEKTRLAITVYRNVFRNDGGPGSGNWGHESEEGTVGGSLPGGGLQNREGTSDTGYTSEAKQKAWANKLNAEKTELLSEDRGEKARTMYHAGYLTYDQAVTAMRNGTIDDSINEYYALLEKNGSTESDKPTTTDNKCTRNHDVDSGKYEDHGEAKLGYIKEMTTGLSDEECQEAAKQLETWVGFGFSHADTATIDKYIDADHTYDGEIYRGLHFGEGEDSTYDSFMANVEVGGTIFVGNEGKNASWSSTEADAVQFSHRLNTWEDSAIISCVANRTASPIAYINNQGEDEVVSHSKAQYTVLNVNTYEKKNGGRHSVITVVEKSMFRSDSNSDGIQLAVDQSDETEDKPASMFDRWAMSSIDFIATKSDR